MITTPVKHDELCDRRVLRVQLVKNGLRCESLGTRFELPAGTISATLEAAPFPRFDTSERDKLHIQSQHSPAKLGRLQSKEALHSSQSSNLFTRTTILPLMPLTFQLAVVSAQQSVSSPPQSPDFPYSVHPRPYTPSTD